VADGKVHIPFRIAPKGKEWLDDLAHQHRVDRSTVLRIALVVARKHETELRRLLEDVT
jgi:hypothetical protein